MLWLRCSHKIYKVLYIYLEEKTKGSLEFQYIVTYSRYGGHPLSRQRWLGNWALLLLLRVNSPPPSYMVTWRRLPLWHNRWQCCWLRQQAICNGIKSWRSSMWSQSVIKSHRRQLWLVVTSSEEWTRTEERNTVVRRSYSARELRNQQVKIYCVTSRLEYCFTVILGVCNSQRLG
jgi:hypothetical protein